MCIVHIDQAYLEQSASEEKRGKEKGKSDVSAYITWTTAYTSQVRKVTSSHTGSGYI